MKTFEQFINENFDLEKTIQSLIIKDMILLKGFQVKDFRVDQKTLPVKTKKKLKK